MPSIFARPLEADADLRPVEVESKLGATSAVVLASRAADESPGRDDAEAAFALADRRCRLVVPSARDLLSRAQAHQTCGRHDAAQRDLRAALALDPSDSILDSAAFAWGDDAAKIEAAERIAERASSSWRVRRAAVTALLASGDRIAHRLRRNRQGVSGWLAWRGGPLRIDMSGFDTQMFDVDPDPDHPLATEDISAAEVSIEAPDSGRLTLTLSSDTGAVATVEPEEASWRQPRPLAPMKPARAANSAPFVTIIVPVYEDYDATRACLEALAAARPSFGHRILVVDDASPNAALKSYLDGGAAGGAFELLRNPRNLGFAAAVNGALALRTHGDALLLNADTLLPPGAVERLQGLSRSRPDIGSITPFSNNGELTSYPRRNEANPLPPATEIARLDASARAANGDALIDMPNGVGFCLYVTETCLDAVGDLPEVYAQGYFEDVEFCLRAREKGFRNVAAPGVFVGHAGSRSFASRKRALVARNLKLIETRFPGYRLETAAFVALDPLKSYRAALDAALPPQGPVILVACGPGAAAALGRRRAERLAEGEGQAIVLTLTADARGRVEFCAVGGGAPQSLRFDCDPAGAAAFAGYFANLNIRRVEWLDPAALPEAVLSAMISLDVEIDALCGDLSWFAEPALPPRGPCVALGSSSPCETCRNLALAPPDEDERRRLRRFKLARALERARAVVPLDRLADSFAARVFKARAARWEDDAPHARSRPRRIVRLGVLYPHKAAAVDRLLLRLGRRLAAEGGELIVFGAALDGSALTATGSVFVTGPVAFEECADVARYYNVEAVLAPDRGGGYGEAEAIAAGLGAAIVYFDWSFGAFPVEWGDLSLDPRICDDKAAALVVAWMNGEPSH